MLEKVVSYTVTWHAYSDACPKCLALSEQTWELPDLFATILTHPVFGDVWDLDRDISLVHPNCRCYLEVTPNIHFETSEGFVEFGSAIQEFGYTMPSNIRDMRDEIREFEKELDRFERQLDNTRLMLIQSILLLRRMNLPADIERAISSMIRARLVAEQWVRGIEMMQAAYLTGGPMAWAFAALTLGIATLTMTDLAMDIGGY